MLCDIAFFIQKDEIFFEIIAATENVIEILVEDIV